jgi:hypothetical protein
LDQLSVAVLHSIFISKPFVLCVCVFGAVRLVSWGCIFNFSAAAFVAPDLLEGFDLWMTWLIVVVSSVCGPCL